MKKKLDAFPFYFEAYKAGVALMTWEEKGKYMDLLCFQADLFKADKGHINEEVAKMMLRGNIPDMVREKFKVDADGLLYNERLETELKKLKAEQLEAIEQKIIIKEKPLPLADKAESEKTKEVKVKVKKEKPANSPLYVEMIKIYSDWYNEKFKLKIQFDGSDGQALKRIINYLKANEAGDENVIKNFKAVLNSYDHWDKFQKRMTRLRQIESNLSNIITSFKNGKTEQFSTSSLIEELNRTRQKQ